MGPEAERAVAGKIDEMLGYAPGVSADAGRLAAAVHPEDAERTMAAIHAT